MLRRTALAGITISSALFAAEPETAPLPRPAAQVPLATQPFGAALLPPSGKSDDSENLLRETERLKAERDALTRDRETLKKMMPTNSANAAELARLRRRLAEVLDRISGMEPTPGAPSSGQAEPGRGGRPIAKEPDNLPFRINVGDSKVDPFILAQAHFRAGEHEAALACFRRIDPEALTPAEKVFQQYLSACCLRNLGKLDDAAALYREVADAREDDFLTECSLWQLSSIGWRRQAEKQLGDVRKIHVDR